MTIVNTTHRFIFVHIPKTAGTSVKHFFGQYTRYCDVEIGGSADGEIIAPYYGKRFKLAKHSLAREIRDAVTPKDYRRFFKFSFVRNPFTRTMSTFHFLKYNWKTWRDSAIMDEFSTLVEFTNSQFFKGAGPDRILMPQTNWLIIGKNQLCVDYIGQVEFLENDVEGICKKLNLPPSSVKLEIRNQSKNANNKKFDQLSGETVDAIRKRYAKDFETFGYSHDPDVAHAMEKPLLGLLS